MHTALQLSSLQRLHLIFCSAHTHYYSLHPFRLPYTTLSLPPSLFSHTSRPLHKRLRSASSHSSFLLLFLLPATVPRHTRDIFRPQSPACELFFLDTLKNLSRTQTHPRTPTPRLPSYLPTTLVLTGSLQTTRIHQRHSSSDTHLPRYYSLLIRFLPLDSFSPARLSREPFFRQEQ